MKPPAALPAPLKRQPPVHARQSPLALPIGVAILAVLHLIVGGFLIGASFFLILRSLPEQGLLQNRSSIPNQMMLFRSLVGSVIFAAGLGMILRHRWGWWWAAFSYTSGLLQALLLQRSLIWLLLTSRQTPLRPLPAVAVSLCFLALFTGLLYYLCRPRVLAWFYQPRLRVPVALALLAAVSIVVLAASYGCLYFVGMSASS